MGEIRGVIRLATDYFKFAGFGRSDEQEVKHRGSFAQLDKSVNAVKKYVITGKIEDTAPLSEGSEVGRIV